MKKIIVAGVSLFMAWMMASPSFAVEHKVSGTFTLDGVMNVADDGDEDETIAYREMQLRLSTESTINEKIKLFSRIDVLDKILNDPDSNNGFTEEDDDFQVDRLWMEVITPIGLLRAGRMQISSWGTSFYDDGTKSGDRLMLLAPVDVGDNKLVTVLVAEKANEYMVSNRDNDKYYLTSTYLTKEFRTGLLFGYFPYNSFLGAFDANFMYLIPYFSGKIGPAMINAEYVMGTGDYESGAVKGDIDISAYWLEVGYPMDGANVEVGYAFWSGDDTPIAGGSYDDIENAGLLGQGTDWEKVLILTSDDTGMSNILDTASPMNWAGMNLYYISGSYDINDKVTVKGLVAKATADAPLSNVDDDYGMEIDLGFSWKCMDNLAYNAKAGYLMGGDWFKDMAPIMAFYDLPGISGDDVTIMSFYHELVLSF